MSKNLPQKLSLSRFKNHPRHIIILFKHFNGFNNKLLLDFNDKYSYILYWKIIMMMTTEHKIYRLLAH